MLPMQTVNVIIITTWTHVYWTVKLYLSSDDTTGNKEEQMVLANENEQKKLHTDYWGHLGSKSLLHLSLLYLPRAYGSDPSLLLERSFLPSIKIHVCLPPCFFNQPFVLGLPLKNGCSLEFYSVLLSFKFYLVASSTYLEDNSKT